MATFDLLPPELLQHAFGYLERDAVKALTLTSKNICIVADATFFEAVRLRPSRGRRFPESISDDIEDLTSILSNRNSMRYVRTLLIQYRRETAGAITEETIAHVLAFDELWRPVVTLINKLDLHDLVWA